MRCIAECSPWPIEASIITTCTLSLFKNEGLAADARRLTRMRRESSNSSALICVHWRPSCPSVPRALPLRN